MSPTPQVSVCIPAYQAGRFLAHTLESVLASAMQDLEVVVLDNCSSDETAEVIASFDDPRLRVSRNEEVLPVRQNWDRAVRLCTGEFIKLVCADDLIAPEALEAQASVLRENPEVALVACRREFVDQDGYRLGRSLGLARVEGVQPAHRAIRAVVRNAGNPIGEPAAVMFRARDYERIGGFNEDAGFSLDLDTWVRLLHCGNFYGISEVQAAFRISRESISGRSNRQHQREHAGLVRRIGSDPEWGLSTSDRLASRIGIPQARARRRVLFAAGRIRRGRRTGGLAF